MAQDQNGKHPRMKPWLRGLLFVSLAGNLPVIGLVLGHLIGDGPKRGHDRRDFVTPYTRAFTEEQRRDLWRAFRRERPQQGYGGPGPAFGYAQAIALLRADSFDVAAMEALLQAQAGRAEDRRKRGHVVLARYLAQMSDADRAAFADRLETQLDELKRRRDKFRKD